MITLTKSASVFEEAKQYVPGGVNSPVRSFRSVGGVPPFIAQGAGSKLFDVDGNKYIDYVLSYGPLLLGHAHPVVTEAVQEAAAKGTSFGAPTSAEVTLAKLVCELVPSMDMVRMVNSGTEATMSAIRLARAYTGRDCIVKFIGCYHGHSDALLVHAGSGATTFGVPDSPGVTKGTAQTTLSVPFNDLPALEKVFAEKGTDIAAVIMEPTPGNMGLVLPKDGYLKAIRELTKKYGSLLIIDEVMSGFRSAQGGSQSLYNIEPDITCLGKVIGGGLPVAAYGGKRDIMNWVSPAGPMYQDGTLSGTYDSGAAWGSTYTVALDFTGTEAGYASNTAFSAIGIANGEILYPGYCIYFTDLRINGETVKLKGRNYTCSDDGKCTRSNLYNEWVDMKSARDGARVLYGDLTGISATVLNRDLAEMQQIRTIEITFRYEPRK